MKKIKKVTIKFPQSHVVNILLLAAAVFLSFINIFSNTFVMDDFDFLVNWPLIQDWNNFYRFFIHYVPPDGQQGIYSPLKTVFHAMGYHVFGLNPLGHHILSLLIHLVSIIFVYRIAQFLTKNNTVAFLTGLIFAVHPVQVEAITYITASIDMIGVMFLFISFYYYIRSVGFDRDYRWSLFFALLAVFTHELTVALPFLFIFYDICFRRNAWDWRTIVIRSLPFVAIVLFYVFCKYWNLGSITRGSYIYDSFYLTSLVTIKAWAKYVFILLFPFILTVNHIISDGIFSYGHDEFDRFSVLSQSFVDVQVIFSLLILGGLMYGAWRMHGRNPLISFCIGWFFLSLLPVSNIVPSSIYFGERYLYPGMMAFALLLSSTVIALYQKHGKIVVAGIAILILFYSMRTLVRNKDWRNEIVFYESIVRYNPQSAYMRRDLGITYMNREKVPEAIKVIQEAIQLRPNDPDSYFALAEAYHYTDEIEKAKDALRKAIELNPDFAEGYYNLALLYAKENKKSEAKMNLDLALKKHHELGQRIEAYEAKQAFHNYFGFN